MPGLVGAIDFNGEVNTVSIVARACEILNRKGLYSVWQRSFNPRVSIAAVHLDILNQEPQPYCDPEDNIQVFMDGEIYLPDQPEASGKAQMEYILKLYRERGTGFASELNGSFVIAIHDSKNEQLIICTDRLASRPLYYTKTPAALYFSPEIKAIPENSWIDRDIDDVAVAGFLSNGFLIGDHTFFNGIKILKPGTLLIIDIPTTCVSQHTYWEYLPNENATDRGDSHYIKELSRLLEQTVARAIGTTQRTAIMLSGGTDSRGILGYSLDKRRDINAVTWGVDISESHSDPAVARELCQRLKINHRFYRLEPTKLVDSAREWVYETEGVTDAIGNYPGGLEMFEALSKDFDILIRGDHGFGHGPQATNNAEALAFGPRVTSSLSKEWKLVLRDNIYSTLETQYSKEIDRISASCPLRNNESRKASFKHNLRVFRYLNHLSQYKQRVIEQRNPLLDNDVLDFLLKLPPKYLASKEFWKRTLTNTFPTLMGIEKARITNMPVWSKQLRQDKRLRAYIIKTLTQNRTSEGGFFGIVDPSKLESFIRSYFKTQPLWVRSRNKIISSVRRSKIWSSRPGVLLRYFMVHKRKGRVPNLQAEEMIMRLLILKLWYEHFFHGSAHTPKREQHELTVSQDRSQ